MRIRERANSFTAANGVRAMGLYPYFRPIESDQDTIVTISGKKVLMMGSNNYLGLTNHPDVKAAAIKAIQKFGTGCAGSRFLNGTLRIHLELEDELTNFLGKEATLLYSTGFQVNQGVISALVGQREYSIIDRTVHASIIDGTRISFGKSLKFEHNNVADLERVLKNISGKNALIIVDGVFSMEGDIAPLDRIVEVAKRYDSDVMVDDAHSIGVLGKKGKGTADHFGVGDKIDLIMGTFSKSLGSIGGFISGDETVIDYLRHHSRAMIFSASPPPASVAAARASLQIMQREPERITKLWDNTHRLWDGLDSIGVGRHLSETPIVPIIIGDDLDTFKVCCRLHEEGLFVNPVVSPAVAKGKALIRLSVMSTHTFEQIDRAIETIDKILKECNIARKKQ